MITVSAVIQLLHDTVVSVTFRLKIDSVARRRQLWFTPSPSTATGPLDTEVSCHRVPEINIMSLRQTLSDDVKTAMRAKDRDRLGTLRLIQAAIKQVEVDERRELDDGDILAILDKMLKQRRDSISQYEDAGRSELADKERAEMVVIQDYLPAALSDEELDALVKEAISETGADGMKDMGNMIGVLRPKVLGRVEMSALSARVKAALV